MLNIKKELNFIGLLVYSNIDQITYFNGVGGETNSSCESVCG